nr:protein DMR6-LIKE OXYGENASE 2-like [Nicotiana tomentosiformis]
MGKDAVLRPSSVKEEALASDPKPVKDNKRKRTSTSEDPKSKTRMARKPRKNTIPLTMESTEEISEEGSGRVPEPLEIEDASYLSQQSVGISKETDPEALRTEKNAPSESLGEIVIGDSPNLPTFSEGAIRDAQALGAHEIKRSHEGEDPFCDLFTVVEDVVVPSDVSGLFCEVQQALNRAATTHRELQQKLETIGKLREEVDMIRADTMGWKDGMDRLAVENETVRAQLSSTHDGTHEFFNLLEEEKQEFAGKHVLDPIRCGTNFNASKENAFFWRDYLNVLVHPHFHFPSKPHGYSDIVSEYCEKSREIARKLLSGISESLGLEESFLDKALDLKLGLQTFVANYYPRCPQPELAVGLPPHSDQGLLTILVNNQVEGLQLQRQGKWIHVNALPNPNSLLVNTADHLETNTLSNVNRAVVNNKIARISIATFHGPSLETIVSPASPLVDNDNKPAAYIPMKYRDYWELHQSNQLDGNSCLERVKIRKN